MGKAMGICHYHNNPVLCLLQGIHFLAILLDTSNLQPLVILSDTTIQVHFVGTQLLKLAHSVAMHNTSAHI